MAFFLGFKLEATEQKKVLKIQNEFSALDSNATFVSLPNLFCQLLALDSDKACVDIFDTLCSQHSGQTPCADSGHSLDCKNENIWMARKFSTSFCGFQSFAKTKSVSIAVHANKQLVSCVDQLSKLFDKHLSQKCKLSPFVNILHGCCFSLPFCEIKKSITLFNKPFVVNEICLMESSVSNNLFSCKQIRSLLLT